jgi:hypothetical protein
MTEHEELRRKAYKRLSSEELIEVTRLHNDGAPTVTLAQQFQVSERQLHRILKNPPKELTPLRSRHAQPFIQAFHSAWIYEELIQDPHFSLDQIASGLRVYFGLNVSCSTIWRHIRGGALESHGFPGFTRSISDRLNPDDIPA